MKISANAFCPCGSEKKFKRCCKVFHEGEKPKTALELMKSRYSAYAANDTKYLIETTHKDNPDYTPDEKVWEDTLHEYFDHTEFKNLEILDFIDSEDEAHVTFKATVCQGAITTSFIEKSKFVKAHDLWLYHSAEFIHEN